MFNLNDNIKNKKFLIYGYGKSGREIGRASCRERV